ncbi:MAG: CinA family protein [Oscillospiraceae bacterium]|nr:CinA family protein [Oscillospiraceae bacterium]
MSAYEFELVAALRAAGASVSTAESCTGGLVAARITSVSGASEAFKYGAVTYCNEAKNKILGVKKETLDSFGAVSAETAAEMAAGVRKIMNAEIGVSVTGLAGPNGGEGKPVGLVYVAVNSDNYSEVTENHFSGDRISVRNQAADKALELALRAAKKLGE